MRSVALTILLLAAVTLVKAQVVTPSVPALKPTPSHTTSTGTPTATVKKPSSSGEIFRWVDAKGRVQYGAEVPQAYQSKARKVDTRSNIVSSQVPASLGAPAPDAQPAADQPVTRQALTEREKCELAWQVFRASQACFDQFRRGSASGGRSLSPDAQGQCKDVAEPAPCR